jgi:hypothetical protein
MSAKRKKDFLKFRALLLSGSVFGQKSACPIGGMAYVASPGERKIPLFLLASMK